MCNLLCVIYVCIYAMNLYWQKGSYCDNFTCMFLICWHTVWFLLFHVYLIIFANFIIYHLFYQYLVANVMYLIYVTICVSMCILIDMVTNLVFNEIINILDLVSIAG